MTVPWKNWCRLCASPHGGVPIVDPDGSDHFLSEKIRKYISISVSEDEKVPSLLCSKCCDQLAAFDNFVHHCLQVQAMFNVLCELEGDDFSDARLDHIRKQFLFTDSEFNRDKIALSNQHSKYTRKKVVQDVKEISLPKPIKKDNIIEKNRATTRSEERSRQEDIINECRKSRNLKDIVEIKRAFSEFPETFSDSLDSDFNEASFENLLDCDDSFQQDFRGSKNGSKVKDDLKSMQSSFSAPDLEHVHSVDSSANPKQESCHVGNETEGNILSLKKDVTSKLRSIVCSSAMSCDVLTSDMNSTNVNSLNATDLNAFICNDSGGKDVLSESNSIIISNVGEQFKGKKNRNEKKNLTVTNKQNDKIYNLEGIVEETESEGASSGNGYWSTKSIPDKCIAVEKKKRPKDSTHYQCDQCDKSFYRKALLNVHLISHIPKDQQPYVCCKCARRFHCEALLRNHERVHLPNEEKLVFPCHVCSKKFSSRSAVSAHLKAIHFGERPFVCHLCGHSFSSKGILQEHLTIHSDEEPWQCTTCSKRFKTKYRLNIHMDTHRQTPYSCPHCPVQLSTRRTLRMHLVVHRDTKAFQCATCGKAFRRAKDLKNHLNLHTGRRPYTCPFCSRTFANGSNCRSHKRRMHPEELRLYEAALAGNGTIEPASVSDSLENNTTNSNTLIGGQELDEEDNQSMKDDSQDPLLTEMALDLQQPSMLTVKPSLANIHDDPVVTAADLTLAPLVTLSSTLPKLEPDDSRLVMNLTTQIHEAQDSMDAMSPLNLNIMSPMNLNISSPLNLNISSPLNLNISSVLHSPTGRNQQQNSMQAQQHQQSNRYQPTLPHHQPSQQSQHMTLQPPSHQTHQQAQIHPQATHQPQMQGHQQHQQMHQQIPRSTIQLSNLQTSLSSPSQMHTLSSQTQLPAHLNNSVHHASQNQTFISLNQQGAPLYSHHSAHTAHIQEPVSSATLMAAAAMAHSMTTTSSTMLPPFGGNSYIQHSMAYGRGSNL